MLTKQNTESSLFTSKNIYEIKTENILGEIHEYGSHPKPKGGG